MNKRLYSGTVSSPRELQAMQADIDMLHRRRSDLEDEELEVMEQREALDGELAALDAAIAALQATVARVAARRSPRPRPRSTSEIARETAVRADLAAADRGVAAARLRAPARAEPGRGRGPARRHDVPGVPPHDPVDGSRADPPRRGERRRVLRQLLRDPRPVTQSSLFGGRRPARSSTKSSIFCDGGSRGNPGPSAIGAVVLDPSTDPPRVLAEVSERIGVTTNNVAEYRALIAGLEAAAPFGARRVRVRADSKLVVEQVKGTWKVKQPHLLPAARRGARVARGATPRSTCSTCPAPRTPTPTRS